MVLLITRIAHTVKVFGDLHPEQLPQVKLHLQAGQREFGHVQLDLKEVDYLGYGTLEYIENWMNEALATGQEFYVEHPTHLPSTPEKTNL